MSIKRLESDPWTTVADRYEVGQLIDCRITRLTKWGAYAGVLTAAGVWAWLFKLSEFGAIDNWSVDIPLGGRTIHTMPVASIFLASLAAMVVVSLITPKPSDATLNKFFPET